eukprot:2423677-Pyramimonas_sp.AAC.1
MHRPAIAHGLSAGASRPHPAQEGAGSPSGGPVADTSATYRRFQVDVSPTGPVPPLYRCPL